MQLNFLLLVVLLSTASCTKVDGMLPAAVRQKLQGYHCSCEPYLDLYRWQGRQVFVLQYKGPACSWVPTYLQADGSYLALPPSYTHSRFTREAGFVATVWNCGQ